MIVTEDAVIFRNAHDALTFAFNVSHQAYDRPMLSRMAKPSSGRLGLGGLEAAAQAGMIRAEVAKLGRIPEAVLIARFAPKAVPHELCPCPKCDHKHPNKEWTHALALLAQHLKEDVLEGCVTTWDMRMQYVQRIFLPKSANISQDLLAKRNNVTEKTIRNHMSEVRKFFSGKNGIEAFSLAVIEEQLIEIGMVQASSS